MRASDLKHVTWRKSSHSSPEGGNCLEWAPVIAATHDVIPVRDSKNPGGPALLLSVGAWGAFMDALKTDAFDRA
ncbi:DUF397 domain-containing protein [Streptomyces sp. NPDC050617]|uniref:DUF397 domain-containing protein n=1 Tax=Streptomyces sp. NPDC050617 TaxID=3154628 RepID=UPI00343FA944